MTTAQTITVLWQAKRERSEIVRDWAIACVVLSMPFIFVLPGLGERRIALGASDFCVLIGCLLLGRDLAAGRLRLPQAVLCCLCITVLVLSLLVNSDKLILDKGPVTALVEIPKTIILWFHFYLLVNLIQTRRQFMLGVRMWLVGGIAVALIGIGGSLAYQFTGVENAYAVEFRAQGTLGDANLFAAHLALSFLLALFYCRLTGKFHLWLPLVLVVFLAGIILSASRGSTLSFFVCLALLWLSGSSWQLKIAVLGLGALLGLLLIIFPGIDSRLTSNPFVERLDTATLSLGNEEAADRRRLWESAWQEFSESPVVGIGRGAFRPLDEPDVARPAQVHNTYLSLLCELGLAGFLLQMAFFFRHILELLRWPVANISVRSARSLLVLSVLAVALCGLTISIESYRGLWMLFGFVEAFPRLFLRPCYDD
jgi:O-antigen ligase